MHSWDIFRNLAGSFQINLLKMNIFRIIPALFCLIGLPVAAQKSSGIRLMGRASYYAEGFHGRRTASGEKFDINKYTAAHRTLPFGTRVKVTNLMNGKAVVLKINDRGPHVKTRIIDLSKRAAQAIDLMRYGAARVSIEVLNDPLVALGPCLPGHLQPEALNTALYLPGNTYSFWGISRKPEGYGFQIGAFTDLISARETCQALIVKGIKDVFIQVAALRDGKLYRVMVHQYPNREVAESEKICLRDLGVDGFIRSY